MMAAMRFPAGMRDVYEAGPPSAEILRVKGKRRSSRILVPARRKEKKMSRSYRKTPRCEFAKTNRHEIKKEYSRRVRRTSGLDGFSDGNGYRRLNDSHLLNEYRGYDGTGYHEFEEQMLRHYPDMPEKEIRRHWYRERKGK